MDPLSTTLAVVTLATAIKDIVEVGQKIHDSFAKVKSNIACTNPVLWLWHCAQNIYNDTQVTNNLRSAQRVAKDIKEMAEEIKLFCQEYEDMLEHMNNFRLALHGLLG